MLDKIEPPQWFMIGYVLLELLKLIYAKLDSENKIYQSVQKLAESAVSLSKGQECIADSMKSMGIILKDVGLILKDNSMILSKILENIGANKVKRED